MMTKWISLFGELQEKENQIVFKGGHIEYEGKSAPALGNFISSELFSGGSISAKMKFTEISDQSTCEIILFYNPLTNTFITAGLGGSFMYAIRVFDQQRWNILKNAGDRKNLKPNIAYDIKVTVQGSLVVLNDGSVNVLVANLPFATPQTQVGIWCLDLKDIIISDFKVETQPPDCFVIMQFTPPYNELYQDVIKPACEKHGVKTIRADESFTSGLILNEVMSQIRESKFIIADISPKNANVYYELGYAHALNKPTILIAEKNTKLPFDVSGFRTLFYENSIGGKKHVEEGLNKYVKEILGV